MHNNLCSRVVQISIILNTFLCMLSVSDRSVLKSPMDLLIYVYNTVIFFPFCVFEDMLLNAYKFLIVSSNFIYYYE